MKFAYQQMIAFLVVIGVMVVVSGTLFFHMANQIIYQTTWTQMENIARSISTQSMTITTKNKQTKLKLNRTKLGNVISSGGAQSMHISIYTSRSKIIYPTTPYHYNISKRDWAKLASGQTIQRKIDKGDKFVHKKTNAPVKPKPKPKTKAGSALNAMPQAATKRNSSSVVLKTSGVKRPTSQQRRLITQRVTDVFVPVFNVKGKLVAVVSVASVVTNLSESFRSIRHQLVTLALLSVVLGLLMALLLSHYLSRRIGQLRRATQEVIAGSLDVKIETNHTDEIGKLANDFNQMVRSLKQSREEIKRQEERRRQFFNDATHEMRTPLTTINGLLEGLAYDAIPEESKAKSIELMRNETRRLIRLVNDNLDYEKIRTGQIKLSKSTFNAVEVLNNVAAQLHKKASAAGDEIIVDAAADVPVHADYDRFIQIIFNISQNAIQFTENGKIKLQALRGNFETIIRISDTGIGMSKEQLKNIWERYYKADPSRKNTKYGESGLGLSIVHQLMELHNGQIEVVSQENKGTTFIMHFPDGDGTEESEN